jgi:hypothetical protein
MDKVMELLALGTALTASMGLAFLIQRATLLAFVRFLERR